MNNIYRLYFWIDGAPENRPGGPWWFRDFKEKEKYQDFCETIIPLLKCYAFAAFPEDEKYLEKWNHLIMYISPPNECIIIKRRNKYERKKIRSNY